MVIQRTMDPQPLLKVVLIVFHTGMWKLEMSSATMHHHMMLGQREISPTFDVSIMSAEQNSFFHVCRSLKDRTLSFLWNLRLSFELSAPPEVRPFHWRCSCR